MDDNPKQIDKMMKSFKDTAAMYVLLFLHLYNMSHILL